jgi:sugar O-acyltransferase (sialic acid O-acetyltransferase NeuD family)
VKTLLIWGAGGHGSVVFDVAESAGRYAQILFCDDACTRAGSFQGVPLLPSAAAERRFEAGCDVLIAVGDNQARAALYQRALRRRWIPASLVHPTAVVSRFASIGPGTVVMPRAVINAGARIGPDCIVNTGAIVEHDCRVGAHAHLSPGAVLSGGASVGDFAHLGSGAVLLPHAEVGDRATVGAGAVVLSFVEAGITAAGVPARPIQKRTSPPPAPVESRGWPGARVTG